MRCVFNGVTAFEFDPVPLADDATDLVYVGEFRHIKGTDLLIEAAARLRADGKPVTLTLAGDGEETEKLEALIQRLNLGDAVRSSDMSKHGTDFPKANCWWCLRAATRCPMS